MFNNLAISQLVQVIGQGRLDPALLVEGCLDRIARLENQIHAWVCWEPEAAMQQAEALKRKLRAGELPGRLAGIPVGVKDVTDAAGFPTRAGSPLTDPAIASYDAPLVAVLRREGAIILGKTVTTQFACFDPSETRNPWAADRSPGGSSSGSAAAVAAGMCLAATGTQTGGSLVRPASFCGVAAWKPSFGRIGVERTVPVAWHLDHLGLIARTAADLEYLTSVVLEPGESVPWTAPPRLGTVEALFDRAEPAVRKQVLAAVEGFRRRGAIVAPCDLRLDFEELWRAHRTIMAVEAAAHHRTRFAERPDAFLPNLASMLEEGLRTTAVDYAAALARQREWKRTIGDRLASFDALVLPSVGGAAPKAEESTGDSRFQSPWSLLGLPAVSVPCRPAADGLPIGLQLVAPHGDDLRLLRLAAWSEARAG